MSLQSGQPTGCEPHRSKKGTTINPTAIASGVEVHDIASSGAGSAASSRRSSGSVRSSDGGRSRSPILPSQSHRGEGSIVPASSTHDQPSVINPQPSGISSNQFPANSRFEIRTWTCNLPEMFATREEANLWEHRVELKYQELMAEKNQLFKQEAEQLRSDANSAEAVA